MFRSAERSPKRRHRAVTLIEAVLYISVALAMIVGGLVFYEQASNAARTSTVLRHSSALLAEGKIVLKDYPMPSVPTDLNSFFISSGAVPPDMVASASTLRNPFGGQTHIMAGYMHGRFPVIAILLANVPQGVCTKLLTATSGSDWVPGGVGATTRVSSGLVRGGAIPLASSVYWTQPYAMNATQAGWMCKYGAVNYTNKTTEPTTPPLSGNVNMSMIFLLDG